jgi:hypothetical protein
VSPVHEHEYETELLAILGKQLLPAAGLDDDEALRAEALALLRTAYDAASPKTRSRLRKAADLKDAAPPATGKKVPPWLLELLGEVLGIAGLHRWARQNAAAALEARGSRGTLGHWLEHPPLELTAEELAAGRRAGLDIADDQDINTIEARLGRNLRKVTMPEKYDFDPRALPVGVNGEQLEEAMKERVRRVLGEGVAKPIQTFILGALSLDGRLHESDENAVDAHIRLLRNETEGTTPSIERGDDGQPKVLQIADALGRISKAFDKVRGGDQEPTYFEEFAFVARSLLGNARNVPIDSSGLEQRVSRELTLYVPGQFGGSLSLPEFETPSVVGSDLVADNIRAVALVYAAWNLEELKLFQVLDRVVEVFMNGQLPVGFDNGGRALAAYYFSDDEQKITEAARRMTYSRVLGVAGGEVSKEAPPNRAFQDLLLRFLSSVSEFDRQRRIADVVAGTRPYDSLSLTAEQVRKSGRDLAANMTLYGYGGTFFVAQKLKDQIARAITVLSTPEILAAYGVQSPFQVVERVAASDLGGTVPNVVRQRTMAEAGKEILDIVAQSIPAWIGSHRPLFEPRLGEIGGDGHGLAAVAGVAAGRVPADIPRETEQLLMRHTEHWLAVNGIKDEQRARLGEPELTAAQPSIPNATADGGPAGFDQLRQMVSAGQTPSLDQLKALLPDVGGIARV